MENAEVKVPWSGGHLGGRSSPQDGRVVAVIGIPEALVAGKPEVLMAVTGIPKAVDTEIPEAPIT